MKKNKLFIFIIFFCLFFLKGGVVAGEVVNVFVEPSFDEYERKSIEAEVKLSTDYIDFYVDKEWWNNLSQSKEEEFLNIVEDLGVEFEEKIHPYISSNFGTIPRHSTVGREERFGVVFHPMEKSAGGYFRSGDQYSIYQYSYSNEKNLVYLSTEYIDSKNLPGYLAHEYMHLVTFNEKNRNHRVTEEVWLNELRSEIIISLLGYDDEFQGSNLENRVGNFLRDPDISLTEWTDQAADYGVVTLFGHYLLDHYGKEVLVDSLKSEFVGIPSISFALDKNEIEKSFSEIFIDWAIAVYLNDCSYGDYYCYKNKELKDIRISPATANIPVSESGKATVEYRTKNWAGNWHRITGESGTLYFDFFAESSFVVPYVLCKDDGDCTVSQLDIDNKGKGELVVENFNSQYESLTIIPVLQQKYEGFNGPERTHTFRWEAKITEGKDELSKEEIAELWERIKNLRRRVEQIMTLIKSEKESREISLLKNNLYYGITSSDEVRSLQSFLRMQGDNIYPEGYITGNFYNLTKKAVVRFQEKHKKDILNPHGLSSGTGFVGPLTRELINSMIGSKDA